VAFGAVAVWLVARWERSGSGSAAPRGEGARWRKGFGVFARLIPLQLLRHLLRQLLLGPCLKLVQLVQAVGTGHPEQERLPWSCRQGAASDDARAMPRSRAPRPPPPHSAASPSRSGRRRRTVAQPQFPHLQHEHLGPDTKTKPHDRQAHLGGGRGGEGVTCPRPELARRNYADNLLCS
jgi:hypothetical protein